MDVISYVTPYWILQDTYKKTNSWQHYDLRCMKKKQYVVFSIEVANRSWIRSPFLQGMTISHDMCSATIGMTYKLEAETKTTIGQWVCLVAKLWATLGCVEQTFEISSGSLLVEIFYMQLLIGLTVWVCHKYVHKCGLMKKHVLEKT